MLKSLLQKPDKIFWLCTGIGLGGAILALGIGTASLMIKSSSLSYSRGNTKIKVGQEVTSIANDNQYANKQLYEKLNKALIDFEELKFMAENNNKVPIAYLDELEESLDELVPTANEAFETSSELHEIVEEAVEDNE